MSYLDVQAFGDALITTQDLDPVYCAIYHARLPEPQLCRLLLAYWCFYHLGVAASISEKEHGDFWEWMRVAAVNEQPPKNGIYPVIVGRAHPSGVTFAERNALRP